MFMNKIFEFIGVMVKTGCSGFLKNPTDYFKETEKGFSNVLLGKIVFFTIIFSVLIFTINETVNN